MQTKECTDTNNLTVNLNVYYIEDVLWNTAAFEFLVIDQGTESMIQAVVTNQLHASQNTDLIRWKGNGLFILLHGVAEIAKKPLYRVTSNYLQYLEIVLHLGKTWGGVLEYYDGILILTSNRVGIFDEALKLRLQLSLRYKSLDKSQRLQIWIHFLKRLGQLEDEHKVGELADESMNSRQIRNTISTARHLAMYQRKELGYEHIQAVIDEANKFDEYLLELNKGYSADEIQRDEKERWRKPSHIV
ncbi:P-loop containing nucleoside triphosphate hydrolase protein [Trichoderma compactum]